MRYVFIDIETTNEHLDFEIDKSELIELWAFDLASKKEFSCCVKINHPLSEFTKRLTWIQDADIERWKGSDEAIKDFIAFLWDSNDVVLIWHNIEWFDLNILSRYADYFKKVKYLDTLQLFWFLYPSLEQYSVEYLYKLFMNKDYEETHRALNDAKDEATLFEKVFDQKYIYDYRGKKWKNLDFISLLWNQNFGIKGRTKTFLSNLKDGEWQSVRSDFMKNNYIFEYIEDEIINKDMNFEDYMDKWWLSKKKVFGMFFKQFDYNNLKNTNYNYEDERNVTSDDDILETYKQCLWDKKERQQQIEIVKDINMIFNWEVKEKISWIEAWTWTGKTYGYLIPAMNFLQKNPDYKVFISTYTKVLQWQLMKEDVGVLWAKFKKVKYCELKANAEWIDLNSLPLTSKDITLYHVILWIRIQRWNYYINDLHYWILLKLNHLQGTNYIYGPFNNKQKIDYNKDFWFKWFLQFQLHNHNLFIVNHSFIISQFGWYIKDTQTTGYFEETQKNLNFKYHILFDEWHNLEAIMRDYFTISYDLQTFCKVIDFILPWWENWNFLDSLDDEIKKISKDIENKLDKTEIGYKSLLNNIEKEKNMLIWKINEKELWDYFEATKWTFSNTDLYRVAQIEIRKLREKYAIDNFLFEQIDLYNRYFKDWNNQFIKTMNKLYDIIWVIYSSCESQIVSLYDFAKDNEIQCEDINKNRFLNQIKNIKKYLEKWRKFLSTYDRWDDFIEWFVEFTEWLEIMKNFWFKMIPRDISQKKKFIDQSQWVCLLSATLYDSKWVKSYFLKELAGDEKYRNHPIIRSPFNYQKNRKITIEEINIDSNNSEILFKQKSEIVLDYIRKKWWRTLILTTNNKDKDKIANFLYQKLNWEWIMIKKHEWWTMNSKSNQQNIQSLINNPKTVLIWSKSYMEWIDIPWENLSLVVLWKLPFLPPRPFIEYQNGKWDYTKINNKYVYQFLCAISFRQAIGRLIRTETDKGEILILDPRINDQSWLFFKEYL